MQIELDTTYMHRGNRYGPGLFDVPDELAIALGHSPSPIEGSSDVEETEEETQETEDKLNINIASAEEIADRLSGIGINTAKKVVELRESLPDGRIESIDQLKGIHRVDWKALESAIAF